MRHMLGGSNHVPCALLSITILTVCLQIGTCLECFECVHNSQKVKRRERHVFPCSEFDGSPRFVVSCPDSAFCVYQTVTLTLATDTISVRTMDGCTPNATDKRRLAEAWLAADGCTRVGDRLSSPSSVLYCFCPFSLCNAASATRMAPGGSYPLALISVTFTSLVTYVVTGARPT